MKNFGLIKKEDSTFQTFADLIFCTLVVLLLFVLVLALEVNQRVRADIPSLDEVEVVEASEVAKLSNEEIEQLSKDLQEQQKKNEQLRTQIEKKRQETDRMKIEVGSKLAAMNGEQRFTGARQPAALCVAYDASRDKYYFVESKAIDHADRRQSGESNLLYVLRKKRELGEIVSKLKRSRGYAPNEAKKIYSAFSQYKEVIPSDNSYSIATSEVGIHYHISICRMLAGYDVSEYKVVGEIAKLQDSVGPKSEAMYPQCSLMIDENSRRIGVAGVSLSPKDLKDILLAIAGRGAMLDLEGIDGKAPDWLREKVLAPAGYISKTPKIPGS